MASAATAPPLPRGYRWIFTGLPARVNDVSAPFPRSHALPAVSKYTLLMSNLGPIRSGGGAPDLGVTGARPMVKCPKCGTEVRDIARFCTRCHATLRFQCPSCSHEQRRGGTCEKCGIDFLKYIGAIMTAKKAEADQFHERLEHRSTLMKNILWVPFTLGIPLIRSLLISREREKS